LLDTDSWWRLQEKIVDDLRPVFPGNAFIASPGPFNGWWQISSKIPYKDTNVIYDFHFFEPPLLTHRGDPDFQKSATTAEPAAVQLVPQQGTNDDQTKAPAPPQPAMSPIVYPVDKDFNFDITNPDIEKYVNQGWDRTAISVLLRDDSTWRDHYNAITVCLEFGIYRSDVDDKSRYNWLMDVHQTLDDMSIPWALWEYRGPYGIADAQGSLDGGMMQALNLKKASLR
jgi:endoglucanase